MNNYNNIYLVTVNITTTIIEKTKKSQNTTQ